MSLWQKVTLAAWHENFMRISRIWEIMGGTWPFLCLISAIWLCLNIGYPWLPQTSTEQSSVSIHIRFWGKATSATFCGKIEAASNWSNAANVPISLAAAKSLARTRDDKQLTMSQGKEHWHFPCNWHFRGMVHSNSTHFNRYQKLGSCLDMGH